MNEQNAKKRESSSARYVEKICDLSVNDFVFIREFLRANKNLSYDEFSNQIRHMIADFTSGQIKLDNYHLVDDLLILVNALYNFDLGYSK